jgi:hypothetical protein
VHGLLGIKLFGVQYVEAEEVAKLSGSIDLGLPGVLALAQHRRSHNVVAVFGADQVRRLQEDGGAVGERQGLPIGLGGQGGFNGGSDILR